MPVCSTSSDVRACEVSQTNCTGWRDERSFVHYATPTVSGICFEIERGVARPLGLCTLASNVSGTASSVAARD